MEILSFNDVEAALKQVVIRLDSKQSYSLDRVKQLLSELGDPQNKIKVIHVAGTSGKTSTSYYISELLRQNGYITGLSVSPHIDQVNERVQVNLKPLEEAKFCRELSDFLNILNRLSIKPTYFEFFVAFAYWYFAKIKVDYAVMETGLGGRLDATNVVTSPDKICVITDIGLDHTDILGKTIGEITDQKVGIIQPENIVFMNRQDDAILEIVESAAKSKKAHLKIVEKIEEITALPTIQQRNFALAKNVADYVFKKENKKPLPPDQLIKASEIIIPGRLERHQLGDKEIILDGAHNTQKMRALINSLKSELGNEKVCVILAVGQNKRDHLLQVTRLVQEIASRIIITSFDTAQDYDLKSLDPSYITEYFENMKPLTEPDIDKAITLGLKSEESKILITGSLYLVGKAKKLLKS